MTRFNEQILVLAGTDEEVSKKKKKGNVLSSVFSLMQSLVSLQEEIEDVKEGLEEATVIEKLKEFDQHIDAMYDTLQQITADGVKAIRKRDGLDAEAPTTNNEGITRAPQPEPARPSLVTSPTLPRPPTP